MRIVTPAFFCFLFAWNIFFHPLIFSLYVSLVLRWVSCRQHIYGSFFYIHSASLCLLVGAFNCLRLILQIFLLLFLDYISPFNICCKAGLVVLNSLNFCLSEKLLISPSILNEILAGYHNLGCRFFPFSTLNISCHSILACRVSAERSSVTCMGFLLYVTFLLLPCCFQYSSFVFRLCQLDQYVSWPVSPWVYPVWDSLCLLDLINDFLFHVGEIFNYNFLIPFLFLFF